MAETIKAKTVSLLVHPFYGLGEWEKVAGRTGVGEPFRTMDALWKRAIDEASRDKTHVFVIAPFYNKEKIHDKGELLNIANTSPKLRIRAEAGLILYARRKLGRRLLFSRHDDPGPLEKELNWAGINVSGARLKVFGTYADMCVQTALETIGGHEPFGFGRKEKVRNLSVG